MENMKLNLVNPMNPNQIVETKELVKPVQEQIVQQEEVTVKKKKNKLLIPLLALALAGIGTYYYFYFNKQNTATDTQETPVVEIKLTLEDIVNNFKENIDNYITDEEIIVSNDDKHIIVEHNIYDSTYTYKFTYNNGYLVTVIDNKYVNTKEIISYILSSIGVYYNVPFEQTMEHLSNKDLNDFENITISHVGNMSIIRINAKMAIIKVSE